MDKRAATVLIALGIALLAPMLLAWGGVAASGDGFNMALFQAVSMYVFMIPAMSAGLIAWGAWNLIRRKKPHA